MRITHLAAALASALITSATFAWTAPTVNLNQQGVTSSTNFTGSFEYAANEVVYGPSTAQAGTQLDGITPVGAPTANSIDLSSLPTHTVVGGNTRNTLVNDYPTVTAYKIYVQDYSAVVANASRESAGPFIDYDNSFTKAIYGEHATSTSAISGVGSYTYTGQLIVPIGEGSFSYTIDREALTGSGYADTDTTYGATHFTLDSTAIGIRDVNNPVLGGTGSASVSTASGHDFTYDANGLQYDITVFGAQGEEVAGYIHGFAGDNEQNITDLPFIGQR